MRRTVLCLALSFLLASLSWAGKTVQITEVGKDRIESDFPSGGSLKMSLCSSGVEVRGTDEAKIRVSYHSREDTSRVKVRLQSSGKEGSLEVDNCPHEDFRITVEVPRLAHLHIRMFAGELDVEGIEGNKDLELSFGELDVHLGKAESYAHVEASVTTGEVDGRPFNVNKGGFFRSFEREGTGKYRLHAHVGAGQVSIN